MNVDDALFPCPFCGGAGDVFDAPASQASGSISCYRAGCDDCDVFMPWDTERAEAIATWNRRAAIAAAKGEKA